MSWGGGRVVVFTGEGGEGITVGELMGRAFAGTNVNSICEKEGWQEQMETRYGKYRVSLLS